MIETTGNLVTVMCDECGSLFESDNKEEGRKRWVAEGWECRKVRQFTFHICPDCAIPLLGLKRVQDELRNPRPRSSAHRRQQLWKRLDALLIH